MNHPATFDDSLLPEALAEIVIVADTHHTRPDDPSTVEFVSRTKQTARARYALELGTSLGSDVMVHLGDLVQDYPDNPAFAKSFRRALRELKKAIPGLRIVAGNHDVGDKPDARMPTHPATASGLQVYHKACGRSWYRFRVGEVAAYVLNTQIMNTTLAARNHQRAWFETTLGKEPLKRLLLFIHLPLYLDTPDEPDIGHYDNLGEPDRSWLLQLIRRHRFERIFAGHVHTRFLDRIGRTRYTILGSPSFTRPGFGHLFSSAPPAERGRDDRAKLGFALLRIHARGSSLHWIRTGGDESPRDSPGTRRVLTPVSGERARSPMGFTLCHALSSRQDIPMAWPSQIRQPVRNDHPQLALGELGIGWIRTSWRDFIDPFQRKRLEILKKDGVGLIALVDLPEFRHLWKARKALMSIVSGIELRIAKGETIGAPEVRDLAFLQKRRCPLTLSPILPGETVPGKQHPRTRTAWYLEELSEVQQMAQNAGLPVDRWRVLPPQGPIPAQVGGGLDLAIEFTDDDSTNVRNVAWALAQAASLRGRRVFAYPLRDLDRTMDLHHGILDTLCNPLPIFEAVRLLNAVLFAPRNGLAAAPLLSGSPDGWVLRAKHGAEYRFLDTSIARQVPFMVTGSPSTPTSIYDLLKGTVRQTKSRKVARWLQNGCFLTVTPER